MSFHEYTSAETNATVTGQASSPPTGIYFAAGFVAALLVITGNGLLSFWNFRQVSENDGQVAHTNEVRVHIKEILPALRSGEASLRWRQVTGSDEFLIRYDAALPRLRTELATLETLTKDNAQQQVRLHQLRELLVQSFPALNNPDAPPRGHDFETSLAETASGRSRQRGVLMNNLLDELDGEEVTLLEKRSRIADHSVRIFYATLGVSTLLSIALLGLVSSLTLRDLRQRQRHAATLAWVLRRKDEALALLDTLLDTAPVGLAFLDREFRYVRFNDALATANGVPGADHLGRRVLDVLPQLWPKLEPLYRSVLETGQPVLEMELQGETASAPGQLRHWLVSYYPVHLGGDTILGIGAVVVDVTERKRTEERLRHSEQQWRQLADAMPQIVWTAQPDGQVNYYNRRWYEYTAFDEGAIGDDSWKPIVHPDDQQLALATWYHAVHTGQPFQIEYRFHDRTTGGYRWHLGRALPVRDADGRIVRWYGTCTDIDDQKRAEEEVRRLNENLEQRVFERTEQLAASNQQLEEENRERRRAEEECGRLANEFRLLLDSSGEGIYGVDNDGCCTFINRVAAELLDGAPEAFHGRHIHELIHSMRADRTPRPLCGCPIDPATRLGFDCRVSDAAFRRLGGTSFPVEYSARPLLDGGAPRGAVVTFTNITERKQREQELREAKEAAEAANRAKSEFLANMSHEIRTPMNGILGMTELALDTDLRPDQREFLTAVKFSADALLKVVNDILDFSRIEAGKVDLNPETFRLREALGLLLKPETVQAQKKGLELLCQVAPDVPDLVVGDWNRLRQILLNLLSNALKFTPQGSLTLSVSLPQPVEQNQEATLVLFSVSDTGIGVPPDKLDTIFDPFVQADGSMARKYGGTGLGLAIVTRLTHMLGGHVWAESEVDKGSTFHFTVRLEIAAVSLSLSATESPFELGEPALAPLRILLAEDNRVNQRVGVSLLTKRGHHVEVAINGKLALAVLAERSFDLVLMDVQMPEMDGFEATARVRQRECGTERRTPIIALTAHAMQGDRERCLEAGMDAYVSKPLQAAVLLRVIRDVLSSVPAPYC